MDPNKSPQVISKYERIQNIFFAHFKSIDVILPNTIFDAFRAISTKIHENHEKIATSARLGDEKMI